MIGKIIGLLLLLSLLFFAVYFFYQNIPGAPEELTVEMHEQGEKNPVEIRDGKTPLFYPNIRFNHNNLSYFIESSCSYNRAKRMELAFSTIEEKVKIISFYPETSRDADIMIGCSQDYIEKEENVFIAGEGGPTKIINTSLYNVILQGKISLFRKVSCDFPLVEIHELLHVLGFDHSKDEKSIMYNYSSCDQVISDDIVNNLILLYSVEPLADLYISEINATKKGRYLDFSIEVRNKGLINADNSQLIIKVQDQEIDTFDFGIIEFGGGKSLSVKNLRLPSRNTEEITFFLKTMNKKELDYLNNEVQLKVA